jgi:uncharacterized protein (DUF302 family)
MRGELFMKAQYSTITREFTCHRTQVDTSLSFDEVRDRLRDFLGHTSIPEINAIAQSAKNSTDYSHEVEKRFVGKSGFMLFAEINHGPWIGIFGIHRKVLRLILGNPLIAITMIRHDINAGLFVPVELLLTDHSDGNGSSLIYVRPSSLIAIDNNADLLTAAKALDDKLEALIKQAINS